MKHIFILTFFLISSCIHKNDQQPVKPKLVVTIMVDQFRSDYLKKYEQEFKQTKGSDLGGFKYLIDNGAYYQYAQYQHLQSLTAPGHATILTGSSPYLNGIIMNEWYDRESSRLVESVDDYKEQTFSNDNKSTLGKSPRMLIGSTVGDELKNGGYSSKVVSVALKDRSSILMGGHRADLSIWFDSKKNQWTTSSYFLSDIKDNSFFKKINNSLDVYSSLKFSHDYPSLITSPAGAAMTIDVAIELIKEFRLGTSENTDMLNISISTHDILGHIHDANSSQMKEVTLFEDQEISKLINFLKSYYNGLDDVLIVLSADHGVAPHVPTLKENKVNSDYVQSKELVKSVEEYLNVKFGKLNKDLKWIEEFKTMHFYLNEQALSQKKLKSEIVENALKKFLLEKPSIAFVVTKSEYLKGILPPGVIGDAVEKSYHLKRSGDVVAVLSPFYINTKPGLNSHMTPYSYDKTVPVIFLGKHFKKVHIPRIIKVNDVAPTLTYILGITPPALNEGRVLTEIFNTEF